MCFFQSGGVIELPQRLTDMSIGFLIAVFCIQIACRSGRKKYIFFCFYFRPLLTFCLWTHLAVMSQFCVSHGDHIAICTWPNYMLAQGDTKCCASPSTWLCIYFALFFKKSINTRITESTLLTFLAMPNVVRLIGCLLIYHRHIFIYKPKYEYIFRLIWSKSLQKIKSSIF